MALNDSLKIENFFFSHERTFRPQSANDGGTILFCFAFQPQVWNYEKMHLYSWILFFFFEECWINCQGDSRASNDKSFFTSFFLDLHFQFDVEKYVCHNNKRNSFRQNYYCKYDICGVFCSWTYVRLFTIEPKEEQSWGTTDWPPKTQTTNLSQPFWLSTGS